MPLPGSEINQENNYYIDICMCKVHIYYHVRARSVLVKGLKPRSRIEIATKIKCHAYDACLL